MSFNNPTSMKRDKTAPKRRPKLWAEGRQQPRFNLSAFSKVSVILSRRAARPVLIGVAGAFVGGARRLANNTFGQRLAQVGRLGRVLPARTSIASGLVGVAALMSAAADVMVPPPPVSSLPAYPDVVRTFAARTRRASPRLADNDLTLVPPEQPASPPEPAPEPAVDSEFDSETLAAIRSMIASMREPVRVTPRRLDVRLSEPEPEPPLTGRALLTDHIPLEPPEPLPPTRRERMLASAYGVAAATVGWSTTALILPLGAFRALMLHLNGEDLKTWR